LISRPVRRLGLRLELGARRRQRALGGFLARPRRFGVRRMRRAISDSARLAFARRVDSDALATRAPTAPNSPHDTTEWCSAARGA
jgi:hypothetical protein